MSPGCSNPRCASILKRSVEPMTEAERKQLQITACKVRMGVIQGVYSAKSGHPGGSLSAADLFTYLYFKEMRVDPQNPRDDHRDRFVLSKGHTAPDVYKRQRLASLVALVKLAALPGPFRHLAA